MLLDLAGEYLDVRMLEHSDVISRDLVQGHRSTDIGGPFAGELAIRAMRPVFGPEVDNASGVGLWLIASECQSSKMVWAAECNGSGAVQSREDRIRQRPESPNLTAGNRLRTCAAILYGLTQAKSPQRPKVKLELDPILVKRNPP